MERPARTVTVSRPSTSSVKAPSSTWTVTGKRWVWNTVLWPGGMVAVRTCTSWRSPLGMPSTVSRRMTVGGACSCAAAGPDGPIAAGPDGPIAAIPSAAPRPGILRIGRPSTQGREIWRRKRRGPGHKFTGSPPPPSDRGGEPPPHLARFPDTADAPPQALDAARQLLQGDLQPRDVVAHQGEAERQHP